MSLPYWPLSGLYFFYFALLGALLPYWPLYLLKLGFTPTAIGQLTALMTLTKIVSPNIWGWLADRSGRRIAVVRLGSGIAALIFSGVFLAHQYWWLALVMMGFSFFWNAVLPQFETVTLNFLGRHIHRYTNIRLWGSVGFIVAVALLGKVLDSYAISLLPVVMLGLFISIWCISLSVPEYPQLPTGLTHESFRHVLSRPHVGILLLVCFLMQVSHGPYYVFYSIYLEDHGYSRSSIGQLWALGVVAEVIIFLIMPRLVLRWGLRTLLLFSLGLAAIRWLLIGFLIDDVWALAIAQLLHAATFGIFHGAAIQLIYHYFRGRHQGRGQAVYSSICFGGGGALGALGSGYFWHWGGAVASFMMAALISLLALTFAWRMLSIE